jgi:hypothetical protein
MAGKGTKRSPKGAKSYDAKTVVSRALTPVRTTGKTGQAGATRTAQARSLNQKQAQRAAGRRYAAAQSGAATPARTGSSSASRISKLKAAQKQPQTPLGSAALRVAQAVEEIKASGFFK